MVAEEEEEEDYVPVAGTKEEQREASSVDDNEYEDGLEDEAGEVLPHQEGKKRVSVFERLTFAGRTKRRVWKQKRGMQVFTCNMAGLSGRYGALPEEPEELARIAERPGLAAKRSKAAEEMLRVAKGKQVVTEAVTTLTANVVTSEEEEVLMSASPEGASSEIVKVVPSTASLDPSVLMLLQKYQQEI